MAPPKLKKALAFNAVSAAFPQTIYPPTSSVHAAIGKASLEKAAVILNDDLIKDIIFALVVLEKSGEKVIFEKKKSAVDFSFKDKKIYVVINGDKSQTYPVIAVFYKDVSAIEIRKDGIRQLTGSQIASLATGLKPFVIKEVQKEPEKKIDPVQIPPSPVSTKTVFMDAALPHCKWTDEQFLTAIIKGDCDAFCHYMDKYKGKYLKSFQRFNINPETAEDCLYDFQLKYIEQVKNGRWKFAGTINDMERWIFHCVVNKRTDALRKRQVRAQYEVADIIVHDDHGNPSSLLDNIPSQETGILEVLESNQIRDKIMNLLHAVIVTKPSSPFRYLCSWIEAYEKGVERAEVADEHGTTPPDLRRGIFRARDQLIDFGVTEEAIKSGKFPKIVHIMADRFEASQPKKFEPR
jgi:DNA-directed RNA polymerase specialized sigma24 family protein